VVVGFRTTGFLASLLASPDYESTSQQDYKWAVAVARCPHKSSKLMTKKLSPFALQRKERLKAQFFK
jgi:hypothetical protein